MLWLLAFALVLAIVLARSGRFAAGTRRWAGWGVVLAALVAVAILTPSPVVVRKLVAFAIMPGTVVWILMVALVVRSWREPRQRWLAVATLVAYSAAGSPISSYLLTHGLEHRFETVFPLAGTERYDALLVMGGGSGARPDLDRDGAPQLGESGDRLRIAATIHAQGRAPILVTSGSTIDGVRDVSAETASLWAEMGIPAEVVVRLPEPRNSAAEIVAYTRLVGERGWTRLGLVTSARHMPRALALCRRHELRVDPLPSDFRADLPSWDLSVIVPSGEGFAGVQAAVWEYLGLAAVHLLGS